MNSALTQKANAGTTENEYNISNAAISFSCISIGSIRWVFLNHHLSTTNNNNNNVYILLCDKNFQSRSYK